MLMTEWDWEKALAAYYEDGKEDGIVQGREEGMIEVARKMKTRGRPLEEIIEDTGLSPEAIASL